MGEQKQKRAMAAAAAGKLAGKVALITGASSGIGRATAIHFSRLGATVVLAGRNEANLKKVGDECGVWCKDQKREKPILVTGDLTHEDVIENILKQTIDKWSKLDILINNAGMIELGSIENTSLEQYDRVFDNNVRSVYQLTKLAVPHLIKSKGNIVNVSSVNGIRSFANVHAYNMSKSALDQFTRTTALELAPKQVRVNSVNPGVIITELQKRSYLHDEEQYQQFLERSKSTHALGRPGKVEEVAAAIAFLASNDASFITGVTLPVDGGRHAMCPR